MLVSYPVGRAWWYWARMFLVDLGFYCFHSNPSGQLGLVTQAIAILVFMLWSHLPTSLTPSTSEFLYFTLCLFKWCQKPSLKPVMCRPNLFICTSTGTTEKGPQLYAVDHHWRNDCFVQIYFYCQINVLALFFSRSKTLDALPILIRHSLPQFNNCVINWLLRTTRSVVAEVIVSTSADSGVTVESRLDAQVAIWR